MIVVVAALLPFLGPLQMPFAKSSQTVRSQSARGWTLSVSKDQFTGEVRCRLEARSLIYERGVVTFRLGHSTDTANAFYRIDKGPPKSVGEVAVEAAGRGAQFQTANLKNPSDGQVHIPITELRGAQAIAIRGNPKSRVRTFPLGGLESSLAVAREKGCAES